VGAVKPKTPRRSRQGQESRQRIIDATFEIAHEQGYQGTSIAKVSARSGLPASSVYWHFADKADLLAACYFNSLSLAVSHQLKSIAFPAISTGIYGYPMDKAAAVASRTIEQFLSVDKSISVVTLVFFAASDAEMFLKYQKFTG